MEFLASLSVPRVEWPPKSEPSVDVDAEQAETSDVEPKHVGGGWYELPNGERVRGKQAALDAMKGFVETLAGVGELTGENDAKKE